MTADPPVPADTRLDFGGRPLRETLIEFVRDYQDCRDRLGKPEIALTAFEGWIALRDAAALQEAHDALATTTAALDRLIPIAARAERAEVEVAALRAALKFADEMAAQMNRWIAWAASGDPAAAELGVTSGTVSLVEEYERLRAAAPVPAAPVEEDAPREGDGAFPSAVMCVCGCLGDEHYTRWEDGAFKGTGCGVHRNHKFVPAATTEEAN